MKKQYFKRKLNELKQTLPKKSECKLLNIIKDQEELESYKKDLFKQWSNILLFYRGIEEKNMDSSLREKYLDYILLGVLTEGLVKLILFFDNPLDKKSRKGTLRPLKKTLISLLKENKKATDKNKIEDLSDALELISLLRNNFVHFPFYYSDDYQFTWVFFQIYAYLLEKFSLWNYLDDATVKFVKKSALDRPSGVSPLEVDLYE